MLISLILCMWGYSVKQRSMVGWFTMPVLVGMRCIQFGLLVQFGRIQGSFNLMYLIFVQVQTRCN